MINILKVRVWQVHLEYNTYPLLSISKTSRSAESDSGQRAAARYSSAYDNPDTHTTATIRGCLARCQRTHQVHATRHRPKNTSSRARWNQGVNIHQALRRCNRSPPGSRILACLVIALTRSRLTLMTKLTPLKT